MKKSTLLKQTEIFNIISTKGLSPNEYYMLCCLKESITPLHINITLTLRILKGKEWITQDNKLSPESMILIDCIERLFTVQKKKTSIQILGSDYKDQIKSYRETFPNKKLPSGKHARSSISNCENALRWFFINNDYDWKTIIKATANYVWEFEQNNYKFMRTAQYFIRKQEPDRTFSSDLADYCEAIVTGSEVNDNDKFKTRVL
tara:strand:+ start:105 stop:716 length:612 start_codon:yes stop_codon:yes gene_type:complete